MKKDKERRERFRYGAEYLIRVQRRRDEDELARRGPGYYQKIYSQVDAEPRVSIIGNRNCHPESRRKNSLSVALSVGPGYYEINNNSIENKIHAENDRKFTALKRRICNSGSQQTRGHSYDNGRYSPAETKDIFLTRLPNISFGQTVEPESDRLQFHRPETEDELGPGAYDLESQTMFGRMLAKEKKMVTRLVRNNYLNRVFPNRLADYAHIEYIPGTKREDPQKPTPQKAPRTISIPEARVPQSPEPEENELLQTQLLTLGKIYDKMKLRQSYLLGRRNLLRRTNNDEDFDNFDGRI